MDTRWYADLHLHSRFSRATSRDLDLAHLWLSARQKGLALLGTGDFTHPGWRAELAAQLEPAEEGLYRLRPALADGLRGRVPRACAAQAAEPRFLMSAEIATIYKKGERTRKVHHVVLAPDLESAERLSARLGRVGNLGADGRPILGLDSRDLLELVLEAGPGCCLIPAHVWTPWFSALGSRSGFDSVDECYADLAGELFAVETGLSSDPPMNWRVSRLDRFRLISSSDAHSPSRLGREAVCLSGERSYPALLAALRTGVGYVGTVEFFPEEGKYHLDGHRKCGARLTPAETRAAGGRCPGCGEAITVGVMHRVEELADRPEGHKPAGAGQVESLVPLEEILGEVLGVGPKSHAVQAALAVLLSRLGPELELLARTPLEEVARVAPGPLGEGLARLRRGQVLREAGYDGEYGHIRLFAPGELDPGLRKEQRALFLEDKDIGDSQDESAVAGSSRSSQPLRPLPPLALPLPPDPDQRAAILHTGGPLLVVAGPGSGKTRTLTERLAHLVATRGFAPEACLALTFTRRAADELRVRLAALLPGSGARVQVHTFHALCLALLQRHPGQAERVGLAPGFRLAEEEERVALLREQAGLSETKARRLLGRVSRWAHSPRAVWPAGLEEDERIYRRVLGAAGWTDFDQLVSLAVALLEASPELAAEERARTRALLVDEYQDVDTLQARLVELLAPEDGELTLVGDPDQSIYGFRGATAGVFERFAAAHPARWVRLGRNYRSCQVIADAAGQALANGTGRAGVQALGPGRARVTLHRAPTERAEAEYVVASLEALFGGHSFFSLDSGRGQASPAVEGLAYSDVAVLYRLDALAEPLVEALGRSGIPFRRRSHERLADALGGDEFDERADRVHLLTLHAAKGLEFRVVFVVGCEDGLIPLRFGPLSAAELEEERRLLYVGMTRAAERLFLCRAERRALRGKPRVMRPSPFLAPIDQALTELSDTRLPARRRQDRQLPLL
jgi:DNA helicase II / ATP-dependent DNA helicase PcrA